MTLLFIFSFVVFISHLVQNEIERQAKEHAQFQAEQRAKQYVEELEEYGYFD
jgi:hypothetical protein